MIKLSINIHLIQRYTRKNMAYETNLYTAYDTITMLRINRFLINQFISFWINFIHQLKNLNSLIIDIINVQYTREARRK